MRPRGLKAHTHTERASVAEQLVPRFKQKFGDNLLAIAADASFARGADREYSDLEMIVFLHEALPAGAEQYLQRVFDGMLIEVIYTTEKAYLEERAKVGPEWPVAASDVLLPVYNAPAVEGIVRRLERLEFPREDFVRAAAHRFLQVQEAFSKVLNAVEQGNAEGMGLLLFDAALQLIFTLSFLNETPFTTFARFIQEARAFPLQPGGFGELLDMLARGEYQELERVRAVSLRVFSGMEKIFEGEGFHLYDQSFDPNVANKRYH